MKRSEIRELAFKLIYSLEIQKTNNNPKQSGSETKPSRTIQSPWRRGRDDRTWQGKPCQSFLQLYVPFASQKMDYAGSSPVGIS